MTSTLASCCTKRRALGRVAPLGRVGLAYAPTALLAIFTPKCPMCLAALLGVGVALPGASYLWLVGASGVLATLMVLRRWQAWRAAARADQTGRHSAPVRSAAM